MRMSRLPLRLHVLVTCFSCALGRYGPFIAAGRSATCDAECLACNTALTDITITACCSQFPAYSGGAFGSCEEWCKTNICGRRARALHSLKPIALEDLVEKHGATCSDVDYDVYVVHVLENHFAGLATPVSGSKHGATASCPNLGAHARFDLNNTALKRIMTVSDQVLALLPKGNKIHVGVRPLSSLVAAFDKFDFGPSGNQTLDIVRTNCVTMLRNMARDLDIPVDSRIIGFFTKRILQSSIVSLVRQSPSFTNADETGEHRFTREMTDEEVVAKRHSLFVSPRRKDTAAYSSNA